MTTRSSSSGIPGLRSDGGGGVADRCFIAISTGDSPVNGTEPVSSSYMTTPRE
jgi:hypothetical protein